MSQYLDMLAGAVATSDSAYDEPRTAQTVTSDALQSATPVTSSGPNDWGGFWRDTLGTVIGYAVTKDAARSGLTGPNATSSSTGTASAAPARSSTAPLLMLAAGVGLLAYLAFTARH